MNQKAEKVASLTLIDLVKWAYEISAGMEFVSSKNVGLNLNLHKNTKNQGKMFGYLGYIGNPCRFGNTKCALSI